MRKMQFSPKDHRENAIFIKRSRGTCDFNQKIGGEKKSNFCQKIVEKCNFRQKIAGENAIFVQRSKEK